MTNVAATDSHQSAVVFTDRNELLWFYKAVMHQGVVAGTASSVWPDRTAPDLCLL